MAKRVLAVVINEGSSDAFDRLKEKYDSDFLQLSPGVGLVRSAGDVPSAVAGHAGIPGYKPDTEDKSAPEGIVFEVTSLYAGYTYPSVWEWLREALKDSPK